MDTVVASTLEINRKADESVHALARQTRLDARVGIWDERSVLLIVSGSSRAQAFFQCLGPRLPGYCSASGRTILAHMEPEEVSEYLYRTELLYHTPYTITDPDQLLREIEQTRKRGYGIDREELIPGIAALAVPIYERDGLISATVSLSGSPARILKRQEKELGQ